jgi:aminoglycoside phosphotransferase (APT) family kinase protein
MQYDTTLTRDELERMTATIAPSWRIRDATPTAAGHHPVYNLTVESPEREFECYLKATPHERAPSVNREARLLAILGRHTGIPVPTVYGLVDEHDTLPAPFTLLEAMPGDVTSPTGVGSVPDDRLRSAARDTGRYLADLHALDAVDAFGFLTADGPTLHGGQPSGDPGTVTVAEPTPDWQEQLRDWATGTLGDLRETRFADVAPEAEPVLGSLIDDVEGDPEPVVARIDSALDNTLLANGEVRAMLDWEFTIAATPAYDVVCVTESLAGGLSLYAPGCPDRRDLVREAILAGYRERGSDTVVEHLRANRECYELLSALRSMTHLEPWYQLFDIEDQIDHAASSLRREVARSL